MKKLLTLSKEQARTLYGLLSSFEVPTRSDNRKRFRFLDVIEPFVDEFDDEIQELAVLKDVRLPREQNEHLVALGKQTKEFTFDDRELFSKVKDIFEKCFKVGTITRNEAGGFTRSPLTGRDAKLYTELEDAFADVKEVKETAHVEKEK